MNEERPERLWLWTALTANRERIADRGHGWHADIHEARRWAYISLGGPHMSEVVEMQIEAVDFDRVSYAKKAAMTEALRRIRDIALEGAERSEIGRKRLVEIASIAETSISFTETVRGR